VPTRSGVHEFFRRFARRCSDILGSAEIFLLALLSIIIWAALGPRYQYSDTWQLVINTATSVMTFLMVFIIQNTQNRDAKAIHLKLDELLRGVRGARTGLVQLEGLTDDELKKLAKDFEKLRGRLGTPTAPLEEPDQGAPGEDGAQVERTASS
jgi:low affinity Fe/Cu permease